MKKCWMAGFLLWLGSITLVQAQQESQFTNYMFNKLIYNPAYAGTQGNYVCANLLYHNQWTNFKSTEDESKAPITQTFSIHSPFGIGEHEFGAGLSILNDGAGWQNRLSINGAINYHKQFSFAKLSGGLSFGMDQNKLDGKWKFRETGDPNIPAASVTDNLFDLGAGIYATSPEWYAGISALHLAQPTLKWSSTAESKIARVYYIHGGYNYLIPNTKIELRPGALVKTDAAKMQVDIHTLAQYDGKYYAGLNYHSGDALSLLLGLNWNQLSVGYSYDLTVSDARPFGGKHEFVVKYCFAINLLPKEINVHKSSRFL